MPPPGHSKAPRTEKGAISKRFDLGSRPDKLLLAGSLIAAVTVVVFLVLTIREDGAGVSARTVFVVVTLLLGVTGAVVARERSGAPALVRAAGLGVAVAALLTWGFFAVFSVGAPLFVAGLLVLGGGQELLDRDRHEAHDGGGQPGHPRCPPPWPLGDLSGQYACPPGGSGTTVAVTVPASEHEIEEDCMPVKEATVADTPYGRYVSSEGWFVLNLQGALAVRNEEKGGATYPIESQDHPFRDVGVRVSVLWPGDPNALYHSEEAQEGFLVLSGECTLVVEEEERTLRQWDYFHCPAGTRHVLVGAGDGPCAVLMLGARPDVEKLHYPASEAAAKHGASAVTDTDVPDEAYADWPGDYEPLRLPFPPAES